jgi:DNA end-binding protein Ku
MPRSIWSGSISFGLVNIPVKMFTVVKEHQINFHMLHDQDNARLQRRMVCPVDGEEVHPEHIVKGYAIGPDQYVRVQQSDLESLAPEKSGAIEIRDFVDLADIDPVYFDRPYYLEPQEYAGKAYSLLVEAMQKTGKVAIAKFVMHGKEYLAALRAINGVICLETMHFGDEVTPADKLEGLPVKAKVNERELKAAEQLIESLATDFDPTQYHDDYRDRVLAMLDKKAKGEKITIDAPLVQKSARADNLMAALQASLEKTKKPRKTAESSAARQRRSA